MHVVCSTHAIKDFFSCQGSGLPWWLVSVYGPQLDVEKSLFFDELRRLWPWLLCGDFNLIYMASNKSNSRLNSGMMGKFLCFL
jgi:hypothetical protein